MKKLSFLMAVCVSLVMFFSACGISFFLYRKVF